jgi:hypothetical protein
MKVATFVLLLTVCGSAVCAQTGVAPPVDVTIGLSAGTPDYCLGPITTAVIYLQLYKLGQGPDDITLRLPLRLQYQNHRSEMIFLPRAYRILTRMIVPGQNEPTILRDARTSVSGLDVDSLMALSSPEGEAGPVWTVAGGQGASMPKLSVLKFQGAFYQDDVVMIPVLVRSSGLDLRGKTVQIATTRDFRSIAPDVVEQLNGKWKDRGTVWAQVAESETVTLHIPQEPVLRNCLASGPPK